MPVKVADTPGPAYQEGSYSANPRPQIRGDLPYFRYPGLYLLHGYASTHAEAVSIGLAMGSQMPSVDWLKNQTLWTGGFIAGFSLAGFGSAAYSGLGAAGVGFGSRVGAVAATAILGAGASAYVDAETGAYGGSFSSGALIGGIAQTALQVVSTAQRYFGEGTFQGTGVGGSATNITGDPTIGDIIRSTNPGLDLLLDLLF